VSAHGGTISAHSDSASTRFVVSLPRESRSASHGEAAG
jgi:nitrogen-specific signal transduction histidine kinase